MQNRVIRLNGVAMWSRLLVYVIYEPGVYLGRFRFVGSHDCIYDYKGLGNIIHVHVYSI